MEEAAALLRWATTALWLLPFVMEATTARGFRLEVAREPSLAMARTQPIWTPAPKASLGARRPEFELRSVPCFPSVLMPRFVSSLAVVCAGPGAGQRFRAPIIENY